MKKLVLLLNRLRQYYLRNKLLFVLFILCGAVNTVAVTYSYGNLMPLVANRAREDTQYRSYTVVFENEPAQLEKIEEFRRHAFIESCIFYDGTGVYAFDEAYPMIKLNGTLEFTNPYQVIVPQSAVVSPGQEIKIDGVSFEVVGAAVCGVGDGYFIPYDTYLEMGYGQRITKLRLYSVERQDIHNDRVVALINEMFPKNTGIHSVANQLYHTERDASVDWIRLIVFNAFLSAVAYAFLLYYILDTLHTENAISLLLGASKVRITVSILVEAVLLSASANGIGLLLHRLLYRSVFTGLNITPELQYTLGDYAFIYLLMLSLSLLTALPLILRGWKLSPMEARQKHL